mmetsp:Transcript_66820/g.186528  ORF Transcript_66820/g.186528 Transcript_66820/m.186528 type:complete len:266 (-) Transcript_66820:3-800(-)
MTTRPVTFVLSLSLLNRVTDSALPGPTSSRVKPWIWTCKSAVGTRINKRRLVRLGAFSNSLPSKRMSKGRRYARVLPVPVGACNTTLSPRKICHMPCSWTSDGVKRPSAIFCCLRSQSIAGPHTRTPPNMALSAPLGGARGLGAYWTNRSSFFLPLPCGRSRGGPADTLAAANAATAVAIALTPPQGALWEPCFRPFTPSIKNNGGADGSGTATAAGRGGAAGVHGREAALRANVIDMHSAPVARAASRPTPPPPSPAIIGAKAA